MVQQNHELAAASGSQRNPPLTQHVDALATLRWAPFRDSVVPANSKRDPDSSDGRKRLSELCKAMYDMCRNIGGHYLEACCMSEAFKTHPVSESRVQAFEDGIRRIGMQ